MFKTIKIQKKYTKQEQRKHERQKIKEIEVDQETYNSEHPLLTVTSA